MTCGMLVAVHRTSDISFSNNHSTYVHLSTLSPSLIALIRLRLVKDASKSRTVDYLKRVYVYTYRTENFIQNFIIYYSFYTALIFLKDFVITYYRESFSLFGIQVLHQLYRWYLSSNAETPRERGVEENEKEAADSGTTSAHYFIKGWEEIAVYRWPVEEKTRIYIYIKETGREEAAFSMKALK